MNKAAEAVALAEVWLDGATSLPAGVRTTTAWTPRQWVDATMPTWEKLCSPIAERVSKAWIDGLPEQAKAQAGPLLAMMGSMGGMAFGSQLGQGLAQLATEVLTSTDVGIPLGPEGTAALLPRSIAEFGSGLEPAGGPGPAVPGHPRGGAPPAVRGTSPGSATGCSR